MIVRLEWRPEWIDVCEVLTEQYDVQDDDDVTLLAETLVKEYHIDIDTDNGEIVAINDMTVPIRNRNIKLT
jgi:hypothetical protein